MVEVVLVVILAVGDGKVVGVGELLDVELLVTLAGSDGVVVCDRLE